MSRLATWSAREALSYHVPRNALHGARLELACATLDLEPPGLLDTLLLLRVKAVDEHSDELGPIGLLKGQSFLEYVVSRSCHELILPLSPANADLRPLTSALSEARHLCRESKALYSELQHPYCLTEAT